MEKSVALLEEIKKEFLLEEKDIRTYSPLTLAFVGDCVYDLVARTVLIGQANQAPDKLHKKKSSLVKAEAQAKLAETIMDLLTEEEQAVYKRGRNAKSNTSAKNASIQDYRKATGLEALMGFLFLTGQTERLMKLIHAGWQKTQKKE